MEKIITSCSVCQSEELIHFCRSDAYDYKKCSSCGHILLSNPPSEREMEEYYQYEEKRSKKELKKVSPLLFLVVTNKTLARFAQYWGGLINKSRGSFVDKYFTDAKPKSVLDIGCGPGGFLAQMSSCGWDVFGTEIGEKLIKMAKVNTKSRNIYKSSTLNRLLRKRKFTAVTLWHVLEHLFKASLLVEDVKKGLSKDSLIIIEVPCGDSLNLKLFKGNWTHLMAPQHLNFWTATSMKKLMEKNSYRIVNVSYPLHFPFIFFSSFVKTQKLSIFLAPILIPFSVFVAAASSTLKLGDTIRVVATSINNGKK